MKGQGELPKRRQFITCVAVMLGAVFAHHAPLHAQACGPNSDGGALDEDEGGGNAHRIYVYVEADMHTELRNSTATTTDNALTQAQLLASVSSMLSIWNATTRSVALVFAGTTSANDATAFCTAVSRRPAIYLHFNEIATGTGASYVAPIAGCSSEELGEVFLRPSGGFNWFMGSQAIGITTLTFETTLIHEFGHVVGLGDIPGSGGPCSTHIGVHSVMNGCPGQPVLSNARWFPTSWDKDCADAFSWGRAVNYRWRGWTSTGGTGVTELGTATYGRGTYAAGWGRTDSGAARYVLYGDDRFRSGSMNTNGNIDWPTTSIMDGTELSKGIGDLDETPLLLALHEESAASDPMRLIFLDDEDDSTPSNKLNPPAVESVETDAELDPTVGNDIALSRCLGSTCTGEVPVLSHLPLASTWDPVAGVTVVVWVETKSQGGVDADGTMWIHAGFDDHDVLRFGTELTSSVLDTPASSTTWTWTGKTLHTPAVACSDGAYPFNYYNCILAWTDRGLADAGGNTIAWTYFKTNSNGTFTFYPVSYTQNLFQAGTSPAVAWFADKFWLAFRTVGTTTSGVRVFTKNSGGDWVYSTYTTATDLVDAPTFIYRDGYESAAVWTESE